MTNGLITSNSTELNTITDKPNSVELHQIKPVEFDQVELAQAHCQAHHELQIAGLLESTKGGQ